MDFWNCNGFLAYFKWWIVDIKAKILRKVPRSLRERKHIETEVENQSQTSST